MGFNPNKWPQNSAPQPQPEFTPGPEVLVDLEMAAEVLAAKTPADEVISTPSSGVIDSDFDSTWTYDGDELRGLLGRFDHNGRD